MFFDYPIWTEFFFDTFFYKVFAAQVGVGLINIEEPEDFQIRKILFIIADRIFMAYEDIKWIVVSEIIFVRDEISVLKESVADFTIGRRGFIVFINFNL